MHTLDGTAHLTRSTNNISSMTHPPAYLSAATVLLGIHPHMYIHISIHYKCTHFTTQSISPKSPTTTHIYVSTHIYPPTYIYDALTFHDAFN